MDPALADEHHRHGYPCRGHTVGVGDHPTSGRAALIRVASRSGKPDPETRALTLWGLLSRLLLVALGVFFVFTAAAIWGVPLGGLVAVGSAVGVALGLGAQSLVRDVIGGFFILAEGPICDR